MMCGLQSYHPSVDQPLPICGICLKAKGTMYVVHDGSNGVKHPFHDKCLAEWLKRKPICPSCRVPIHRRISVLTKNQVVNATVLLTIGLSVGVLLAMILSAKYPEHCKKKNNEAFAVLLSIGTSIGAIRILKLSALSYFTTAVLFTAYCDLEC